MNTNLLKHASAKVFHLILVAIVAVGLALGMGPVPAAYAATVTIDFPPATLPFPNGTNITNEFSDQGIVFSADDSDLPPEFQKSLGSQENLVVANVGQGGTFTNLFRLIFISAEPVVSVSVTLSDSNYNPQTHTLTAFDATGVIVDSDSFTESDLFPDPFTLTVSSSAGIAFIVAIEQPFGAEVLESISYTTAAVATFPTTPVLDNFNRMNGGLGTSWAGVRSGYRIVNQQVDVRAGGPVFWKPSVFGADQEAFVTLTRIDPSSTCHTLMLKVQNRSDLGQGVILVSYNAVSGTVDVEAWDTHEWVWRLVGSFTPSDPVQNGDQLGARALPDGTVQTFINGTLVGTADAGSFYAGKGGRIGLWFLDAYDAVLDDFGGGTITQ